MVRLGAEGCRQGRGLHVIDEVAGRTTDFVVRPDGTIMHALAVIYVLRGVEGVGEFKIIQHDRARLEVLVVPDAKWTPQASASIELGLKARLGPEVRIETRLVEAVPPEASGKHRYVVSRVGAGVVAAARATQVH
jgi:phenylacetate-CoA ligase